MAGMPDIALIAPIVLPLLGAGALLLLGEGKRYRPRDPLPALIAGTVFAAALLLPERASRQVELLPWPWAQLFGSRPALLVDQFALVFVLGLALVGVTATVVGNSLSGRSWAMALLLWSGSFGIVMSANPLTLLLSWLLCEAALIGASLMARESRLLAYRLAAGGAGAVALLLLTMRAEGYPPTTLQTVLMGLSPRWIAAFFAIGAVRMGLYPLHLAGFAESDAPLAPLVLGRLASATAGLYLWFRGLFIIAGVPFAAEYLVVLGGLAVLMSALASWGARTRRSLFPWLMGFEVGVIAVALGLTASQSTLLATLEMLNLLLAGSVFGLGLYAIDGSRGYQKTAPSARPRMRQRPEDGPLSEFSETAFTHSRPGYAEQRWARGWVRGLAVLAMASLLGLPPTPGFVARWGLYRHAIEAGDVAAVLPVVVASGLLVPSLVAAIRVSRDRPTRRLSNHAVVGLAVLGLPLVLASAQPLLLAPVVDILTQVRSYAVIAPLIRAASTRVSAEVMALLLIPVLAGYSLERVYEHWRVDGWLEPLWEFISLRWLYDLLASTVLRAAIAVSLLLTFLELGSTLGWVIVVGLLVLLLVLRR